MQSSPWLLSLLGFALLFNQGCCRPQQDDYINDGEGDDYDSEDDNDGPPPTISSKPLILTLDLGDVAVFPCVVDGAKEQSFARVWRKGGTEGLYTGNIKSHNNPHIRLLANGSLEVGDITHNEAGTYNCIVSTNVEVKHTLNIKGPAKITKVTPHEELVTVKKHATLTLECYAQGFPVPSTKWYKDGSVMTQDEDPSDEGARLVIYEVTADNAGEYQCRSYNEGQATPDEKTITVQVTSPPEIEIEKAVISAGEGYESELTCILTGQKKSELKWFKKGDQKQLISHSSRIRFEEKGDRHTLRIHKTQVSDFGDYMCEAKNAEGQASATITLTGTPSTPKLEDSAVEENTNNPVLVYVIESYAPIEEYELLYKKDSEDSWVPLKPAVSAAEEGKVFRLKHMFTELQPGNYEAKVRAKNSYGWSTFSSTYQFPRAVSSADHSLGSELRISLSLIVSLLVARLYC